MRNAIGACALLVAVALVTGCDSEQPLQVGTQTVDVTVTAPNATVGLYDTWVVFEDKNGNGISDDDYDGDGDDDEYLYCQVPTNNPRFTTAASAPWPFSFEVQVIRAGETEAERVSSDAAIRGTGNLARYDTASSVGGFRAPLNVTHPAGTCSAKPAITCDPTNPSSRACSANAGGSCVAGSGDVTRRFVFANGLKQSGASFGVLTSTTNPLYELDPEDSCVDPNTNFGVCITSGANVGRCSRQLSRSCDPTAYARCPGRGFGPETIDGGPSPFSLQIGNGDTVRVRARRLNTAPLGFEPLNEPGLSSSFLVDGKFVNVEGSTSQSLSNPSSSIDYYFTAR